MKKLICTILSLVMLICILTACAVDPKPQETTGKPPVQTTAPEDTTKPSETTTSPEVTTPEETTTETPVESIKQMKLMDILNAVYEKCGDTGYDHSGMYNAEIEADALSRYFGTDFEFVEAVSSEPFIGGGYSLCFVRVAEDKTNEVASLIETHADPGKWICMFAEEKVVVVNGDVIMLCMASKAECAAMEEAFLSLS